MFKTCLSAFKFITTHLNHINSWAQLLNILKPCQLKAMHLPQGKFSHYDNLNVLLPILVVQAVFARQNCLLIKSFFFAKHIFQPNWTWGGGQRYTLGKVWANTPLKMHGIYYNKYFWKALLYTVTISTSDPFCSSGTLKGINCTTGIH